MLSSIGIFGLAIATFSSAQTTTVNLFIPGADQQPLVGSVAGADATATTYVFQCSPGTDSSDCGFGGEAVTLTQGPTTAKYTFAPDVDTNGTVRFTGYFDCSIAGTTSAVCVESFGGIDANFPGISTEVYTGSDFMYIPVTITAGAAAGSGSIATTTSKTNSAATHASGTIRETGSWDASTTASASASSISKATGRSAASGATAQTTSTSTSLAGAASATGHKGWAIGGAALALAIMA